MKYKKLLLKQNILDEYIESITNLYTEHLIFINNKLIDDSYKMLINEKNPLELREHAFLTLINLLKEFPDDILVSIRKQLKDTIYRKNIEEKMMDTESILSSLEINKEYYTEDEDNYHDDINVQDDVGYLTSIGMVATEKVEVNE